MRTATQHPRRRSIALAAVLAALVVLGAPSAVADSPPAVTIDAPTAVDFDSAHLSGTVNPEGGPSNTAYKFEYTTTPADENSWFPVAGSYNEFEGAQAEETSPIPVSAEFEGLTPGTEYFVRLAAENEGGANRVVSEVKSFATDPADLPTATFGEVTAVTGTSAHFTGTVNSGGSGPGEATKYAFRCSPECPGIEALAPVASDGTDQPVAADATGLAPNTEYTVTLHAENAAGPSEDGTTFTTAATGPEAETLAIQGPIADTSARVVARVDANNTDATYRFEYGTTSAYGSATPDAGPIQGNSPQTVGADLTGLEPETTYHYRVVADNGVGGEVAGSDRAFTTSAEPAPEGPCPNEAIRRQQGSEHLADCRGYELISIADKDDPAGTASPPDAADERIIYDLVGGGPGSTTGARSKYVANRTPNGWVSQNILPPASQMPGPFYAYSAFSEDLTGVIAASWRGGLGTTTGTPDMTLVRLDTTGGQQVIWHFPTYFGEGGPPVVAAEDLSHAYAPTPNPIDPSHQPGTVNVYDFAGSPELVSRMPDTGLAPSCGVPFGTVARGFPSNNNSVTQHWVSTDGQVAYFQSYGDAAPECQESPLQLYVRARTTETTTLISSPPLPGDPDMGVIGFIQATPDGSAAFYRTQTSLDPTDDLDGSAEDADVYRWSQAGSECLTCVVPRAEVVVGIDNGAVVSEDGEFVYFNSMRSLTPDAPPGPPPGETPYAYVLHQGDLRYIGPAENVQPKPSNGGQTTPDGNVLLFRSNAPELDVISGAPNQGFMQYYRYEYSSNSVTCLSCSQSEMATAGVSGSLQLVAAGTVSAHVRAVSDDGSTVAFPTSTPLVPADVNSLPDLYLWREGEISLLTDGVSQGEIPVLATVSADGSDVYFEDAAKLVPGIGDGSFKLYDARIGGGFPANFAGTPMCQGEQCLPPPSPSGSAGVNASESFGGDGNVRPKRARRCPKGKHQIKRDGKTRCVKRRSAPNRGNHNRGVGR